MDVEGFQDGVYAPTPELNEDEELEGELDSDVGLHGTLTLDLSASATGGFDELLEVLEVPLGSFEVGPVGVTPYLGINVRVSGDAEAGAQLSVVAPFDVSAAIDKRVGGQAGNVNLGETELPAGDRSARCGQRVGVRGQRGARAVRCHS